MIAAGIALLGGFLAVGHIVSNGWSVTRIRSAGWFLPAWFVIALGNLLVGVLVAGYSVAAELPILALVFGVPAAAAVLVMYVTTQQ